MAHFTVTEQLTYYSEHKVHSLDLWLPFHQGKGNRGFGAYEPRKGGDVAIFELWK